MTDKTIEKPQNDSSNVRQLRPIKATAAKIDAKTDNSKNSATRMSAKKSEHTNDSKDQEAIRKLHNESLIGRLKANEPLWSFDSQASWFPPRPIIKKDEKELNRLYAKQPKKTEQKPTTTVKKTPKKPKK